jgi:hypothetical protein
MEPPRGRPARLVVWPLDVTGAGMMRAPIRSTSDRKLSFFKMSSFEQVSACQCPK